MNSLLPLQQYTTPFLLPIKQTLITFSQQQSPLLLQQVLQPLFKHSFLKQTTHKTIHQILILFTFLKQYFSFWNPFQKTTSVQTTTPTITTISIPQESKQAKEYIEQYFPIASVSHLQTFLTPNKL